MLTNDYELLAQDEDGTIMVIERKDQRRAKVTGVQFHPEAKASQPQGRDFLHDWLEKALFPQKKKSRIAA